MVNQHVEQYLSYLVNQKKVAASIQPIALNVLDFLYREFIRRP
ncbi:MAG: phage integrase N-terminal SAM-like domain-containing protein [Glaciecola sp.]